MTWTVPGWVEAVVEDVVVADDVLVVVDDEVLELVLGALLVVEDEDVVVKEVDEVKTEVVELVAEAELDDRVETPVWDMLLIDVLSPSEDDVGVPVRVDAVVGALLLRSFPGAGWRRTSAANAPARRTRVIPAMRANVVSRPARPGDLLARIFSLVVGGVRPLSSRA